MKKRFVKNPFKLFGFVSFIRQLHFTFPVLVLIYQNKNVSIGDYFLIQGIYLWAILFMEVPSGYFGDLFSRRLNLAFSALLSALGCAVWLLGSGFWILLVGELLFGFSDAFLSGTDDAYLYGLCEQYKKKNKFHLILSKQVFWAKSGFFVAACSGAFLFYFVGANGTIFFTMFAYLIAMLCYLILPEIKEQKRKVEGYNHLKDILSICYDTMKNRDLKIIILTFAVVSSSFAVFHWGLQPLMVENDIPVFMFSIVTGSALFAWSFWSAIAGKILEKVKFSGVINLSIFLYVLSYILVFVICKYSENSIVYVLLPLVAFLSGNRDLSGVASSVLINHRISAEKRSTVLSVRGLLASLFRGGTLILIKPLSEVVGMQTVFLIGTLLIVLSMYFAFITYKSKLEIKQDK